MSLFELYGGEQDLSFAFICLKSRRKNKIGGGGKKQGRY